MTFLVSAQCWIHLHHVLLLCGSMLLWLLQSQDRGYDLGNFRCVDESELFCDGF